MKERQVKIKKMPDKETLEKFVAGTMGKPTVTFDTEKGEFVRNETKLRNTSVQR